VTGWY